MIRKVRLPLKIKIIALMSALLLGAISIFLLFALDLFHKDKSAYIYEITVMTTENLASQTKNFLQSAEKTLRNLASKPTKEIVNASNNLLAFTIYSKKKKQMHFTNSSLLTTYAFEASHFDTVRKHFSIPFKSIGKSTPFIQNTTIPGGLPHVLMAIRIKNKIYAGRFLTIEIIDTIKRNELYESAIIDKSGELALSSSNNFAKYTVMIAQTIIKSGIKVGSKEIQIGNRPHIISFVELPKLKLYAFSIIDKETAFEAARFLIQKSLFISLLVLAFGAIIGIFFSRGLTSHIDKLFKATQKIATGDFTSTVSVKARDEIGALADSFNYMSSEIVRYMDEMKEKARVENELKVAKLVQDSFFPSDKYHFTNFDMAAFNTPATECGGDWWGYIENDNKLILFMADATGHGVPAAFLTATAKCCSSNLEFLAKNSPQLLNSPSDILKLMNHAVCNVAESILMTCFVCIIDPENQTLRYSNASHNPPLLFHPEGDVPEKKEMHPLIQAQGPRLGHDINSTFEVAEVTITQNDHLILFTDGILESCNQELAQWGQRNFLKSLLKSINHGPKNAVTSVITELDQFREGKAYDDDVTFVITRIKNGSANNSFNTTV